MQLYFMEYSGNADKDTKHVRSVLVCAWVSVSKHDEVYIGWGLA